MGDVTTIGEILEFAIAREAEAVAFYMAMADKVTNPSVQKFFEGVISEEMEHKSRLELELMKEGIVATTVGVFPEASGREIAVDSDQIREHMLYTEALELAIQKEKRSFRLYARLAGVITDDDLAEALMSLAEEEARHIVALEEQYKNAITEQ